MNTEHGSPYDRGSADSYYGRSKKPHYYPHGSYKGDAVTEEDMTQEQIGEYNKGYEDNEELGNKNDYGYDEPYDYEDCDGDEE
jgi:hypothetical protein